MTYRLIDLVPVIEEENRRGAGRRPRRGNATGRKESIGIRPFRIPVGPTRRRVCHGSASPHPHRGQGSADNRRRQEPSRGRLDPRYSHLISHHSHPACRHSRRPTRRGIRRDSDTPLRRARCRRHPRLLGRIGPVHRRPPGRSHHPPETNTTRGRVPFPRRHSRLDPVRSLRRRDHHTLDPFPRHFRNPARGRPLRMVPSSHTVGRIDLLLRASPSPARESVSGPEHGPPPPRP